MKILAIADRPPRTSIKETLADNSIDLICTLGDLDYFSLIDLKSVTNIPKIGVYGNHDSGRYFEELGIRNMHLTTFELGGLVFGGFQGCVRYKENPDAIMYTQEEASELIRKLPRVDVVLTHCPPYGVNDEPEEVAHQGFKGLREYVEQQKPKYLMHGHTYPTEETMVRKLGQTEIMYIYEDKIIELLSS